jgi:hypothetical protein
MAFPDNRLLPALLLVLAPVVLAAPRPHPVVLTGWNFQDSFDVELQLPLRLERDSVFLTREGRPVGGIPDTFGLARSTTKGFRSLKAIGGSCLADFDESGAMRYDLVVIDGDTASCENCLACKGRSRSSRSAWIDVLARRDRARSVLQAVHARFVDSLRTSPRKPAR